MNFINCLDFYKRFIRQNKIIEAIEKLPGPLMSFIYHVIEMSINDPSAFHLLDGGLELWFVVNKYTSTLNEPILKLSDNLIPIMGKLALCKAPNF